MNKTTATILTIAARTRAGEELIRIYGNEWKVIGEESEEGEDCYIIENTVKANHVEDCYFEYALPKKNSTHLRIDKIDGLVQKEFIERASVEDIIADLYPHFSDIPIGVTSSGQIQINGIVADTVKAALIKFGRSDEFFMKHSDLHEFNWE